MKQRIAVSRYDDRHRIQTCGGAEILGNPIHRVQHRREIKPKQHDDLQRLYRVSQKHVESCDDPSQPLCQHQQHDHVEKNPESREVHTVKHHHDHKENDHTYQVVNQVGDGDGDWQDFGRNYRLRNQWRIIGYDAAIPDDGIAEENPGKQTAQNKNGEAVGSKVGSHIRPEDSKYEDIADQQHDGMHYGPQKSADRTHITML